MLPHDVRMHVRHVDARSPPPRSGGTERCRASFRSRTRAPPAYPLRSRTARRPTSSHRPDSSRPTGWHREHVGTRRARPSPRSQRCARGGRAGSGPASGPSPQSGRRRGTPRALARSPATTRTGAANGVTWATSAASAAARDSSMSTSTSSVGMPRRTSALAAAAPTNPAPTMPTFTRLTLSVRARRPRCPRAPPMGPQVAGPPTAFRRRERRQTVGDRTGTPCPDGGQEGGARCVSHARTHGPASRDRGGRLLHPVADGHRRRRYVHAGRRGGRLRARLARVHERRRSDEGRVRRRGERRPPLLYVVLASLVGGVALVAGTIAIIWGNEAMLATLVVAMAALWLAATARHQISGRAGAPRRGALELPLGQAA